MKAPVFDQTYQAYLEQVASLDLERLSKKIGLEMDGDAVLLPYFDRIYRINGKGIQRQGKKEPSMAEKVVLCRYLIMFPDAAPKRMDWVAYRDFLDAAPFAGAFRANVEMILAYVFSGKRIDLMTSCVAAGGITPADDFDYDASFVFQALPHLDLLLLFNDIDEIFPAKCLVLFDKSAEKLLDMECLAMAGWRLADLVCAMSGVRVPELE